MAAVASLVMVRAVIFVGDWDRLEGLACKAFASSKLHSEAQTTAATAENAKRKYKDSCFMVPILKNFPRLAFKTIFKVII